MPSPGHRHIEAVAESTKRSTGGRVRVAADELRQLGELLVELHFNYAVDYLDSFLRVKIIEQEAARQAISNYFRNRNPVTIDGIPVKPTLVRDCRSTVHFGYRLRGQSHAALSNSRSA